MLEEGIEPSPGRPDWFLRPARIPVPPLQQNLDFRVWRSAWLQPAVLAQRTISTSRFAPRLRLATHPNSKVQN